MASPLEVLANAQGLLEQGISRGAYARNSEGEIVGTHSKAATSYCVIGAVARSCGEIEGAWDMLPDTLKLLAPFMDEDAIIAWNDHASDEEILSVVASAVRAERSRIADKIHALAA